MSPSVDGLTPGLWAYYNKEKAMTRYPKRDFEECEDGRKPANIRPETWIDWDPRMGSDPMGELNKLNIYNDIDAAVARHQGGECVCDDCVAYRASQPQPTAYSQPHPTAGRRGMGINLSPREDLLLDGANLTGGARNTEYGEPIDNLTMTGELKAVFHKHMQRYMGPAEKEALDMVLTKMGRLGRGAIKRDTYMDAAVYMAIAYEVAMKEVKVTEEIPF